MNDTIHRAIDYSNRRSMALRQLAIRIKFSLVVLLSCIVAASRVQGATTFRGLRDLPGGQVRSQGFAVSGNGSVVVGSSSSSLSRQSNEAFHWTAQGGMVGLGVLPDNFLLPTSFALGVSNDGGVIVGSSGLEDRQAFRWTAGGGMVGLGLLPGDPPLAGSSASSTSADGSVVVGTSGLISKAFRWSATEGMVPLGGPPGGFSSHAYDVSADGTVIAGSIEIGTPFSHDTFRWTAATGIVRLGGGDGFAISADGSTIAGSSGGIASRWTAQGDRILLGDLAGGRELSVAYDTSADGSVIVGWGETAFDGSISTTQAFHWTADTGLVNLRDFLITNGATGLDGWTLTEARGVSWDGLTIVGTGAHNGVTEAWVATIPEPATVVLAVVAALGVIGFRIRTCRRRA
jgi:probable HAF family extracellular repeat protein